MVKFHGVRAFTPMGTLDGSLRSSYLPSKRVKLSYIDYTAASASAQVSPSGGDASSRNAEASETQASELRMLAPSIQLNSIQFHSVPFSSI